MTELVIVGLFLIGLIVFANGKFRIVHRIQEWRYGRQVDETLDWAAFNKAFEDTK